MYSIVFAHTHTHTHARTYTHTHDTHYTHTHTHTHTHYTHAHTHTHTHTHTHMHKCVNKELIGYLDIHLVGLKENNINIDISPRLRQSGILNTSEYNITTR